jgi:biotin carboxylase
MLSPGYPVEMNDFTRGLSEVGATVVGLGDQPEGSLPASVRRHLATHIQVASLWDEGAVVHRVREVAAKIPIHKVACLWEPGMVVAAQIRKALGLPGMGIEQSIAFRDKEIMKQVLDNAGIRTPHHARARTRTEAWEAAERIGYPLIVKPISGAGATDTYRCDHAEELERALIMTTHVDEISVEEFVEGEEFTFDTVCAAGHIFYHNVMWYRPRPLEGKLNEWISPQAIVLRDPDQDHLQPGREMGLAVLKALGFMTGFSHMEWYRTAEGEAVFGEIGARPPGARAVDLMNIASDIDLYVGWAEAFCHARLSQPIERKYNAAIIFKRAQGRGRIYRIEGLQALRHSFGPYIALEELLPIGAHRRDWKQIQVSDGFLIVRHPDLQKTIEMADRVAQDLRLYAG